MSLYYIVMSSFFLLTWLSLSLLIYLTLNKKNSSTLVLESGMENNPSHNHFSIRFFTILLIFLLFDIEIVILMPLLSFKIMGALPVIISPLIFILFMLMSLSYEWKKNNLSWI